MLELVFTVCTIVQGATCRLEPPLELEENTTLIGCLMASQVEGAKWVLRHPNFYVQRVVCRPVRAEART